MTEIASKGQLRWSFVRWAAVAVPGVLLLGFLAGGLVASGRDNAWYAGLIKPPLTPPDWVFPIAWSLIYAAMGLALATVLNARGARGRGLAIALFAVVLLLLLGWQPLFFAAHQIAAATALIVAVLLLGVGATVLFARIRRAAAWLMVPLLVWIGFAGVLCWRLGQLNPDAARVAPGAHTTQML